MILLLEWREALWDKFVTGAPEAKRLKALKDENAKLEKLLADQMLDLAAMKDLVAKR